MKRKLALWAALALALCPALSPAQSSYPNRPVKIIVPIAPGGASDFVGRIMQPRLSELLGQPIVIENRGGAAGTIGMEVAARSAPDGYTLVLGNVGSTAINPGVFTNLAINNLRDFIPVTQVVDVPGVLIDDLGQDRKSTRLNSSHLVISYAVFCLKKKNKELYI